VFDVGASELVVIGVTALLVVGPDRLPRVARTAGLYLGRARRAVYQLRLEVERELNTEDLERARQLVQRGTLPLDELLEPAALASPRAASGERADTAADQQTVPVSQPQAAVPVTAPPAAGPAPQGEGHRVAGP